MKTPRPVKSQSTDVAYSYPPTSSNRPANRQIVERAAAAIRAMGHEVATPDEARKILQV
jgi:hypothetical protein